MLDGYWRDTRGIVQLGFPTFSAGGYAQDQGPRGKVIDFRIGIEIEGVRVARGDVIFGDLDGVCVVPAAAVVESFTLALEKAREEKHVRRALEEGMSARQAFKDFGIL